MMLPAVRLAKNVRLDSTADFSLRIDLALYALLHHFPARKMRGCQKKAGVGWNRNR